MLKHNSKLSTYHDKLDEMYKPDSFTDKNQCFNIHLSPSLYLLCMNAFGAE